MIGKLQDIQLQLELIWKILVLKSRQMKERKKENEKGEKS